jgi:hypothetical protein
LITTLFNVRLRAEPALDSDEVGVLAFGTEVTALARGEDPVWIYVGTKDLRGWGAADLFDITLEHLESLPTYSENAIYELLPDEDDAAGIADGADAQPTATLAPVSTPFLFSGDAEPTAEVTEAAATD